MRSTFYCQAQLREPWALEMPVIADSVSFHVVTTGSCWIRLPGADPVEFRAGDLALVPHGRDVWLFPCPRALDYGAPGDWTLAFRRDGAGRVESVQVGCWLARNVVFAARG